MTSKWPGDHGRATTSVQGIAHSPTNSQRREQTQHDPRAGAQNNKGKTAGNVSA